MTKFGISFPTDDNLNVYKGFNHMTLLKEYNASGNVVYEGIASAGTNSSVAGYQIKTYLYDNGSDRVSAVLLASGNFGFSSAWTARSSITFL